MKWSFKIGRFAGIDVYMHFTFILLIGWVALYTGGKDRVLRPRWPV